MKKFLTTLLLVLLFAAPAFAACKFLPMHRVVEDSAWSASSCNGPFDSIGEFDVYKYVLCQDNGTWSAGDFLMRFHDTIPTDLNTMNVHAKVLFETEYGTGAGSSNGMTFLIGAQVYDDACALCSGGGCVSPCQVQTFPTSTYQANQTQAYSNGRCQGSVGGNDDATCTANATCTSGGVCITKLQYTDNDSDPIELEKASDGTACNLGSCGGRAVTFGVQALKTGGAFTLDRDFRIRGLLVCYDCPASGSGGTVCPDTL